MNKWQQLGGKQRARKADNGHTIVRSWKMLTYAGVERRKLECQCGKTYTGAGPTAFYTHQRHIKQEAAA